METIARDGMHGFEYRAELIRDIFVENGGALDEILSYGDETIYILARFYSCIGIRFDRGFIGKFFIREIG
jgi:hypothetical protein